MEQSPFKDKLFAITGAASGIGRALASVLASRGALLTLADMNEAALKAVKAELQRLLLPGEKSSDTTRFHTFVVDVRSQKACDDWIAAAVAQFKQSIAGAANLAGVIGKSITQERGSIRNISDDEFDFVMDVNVKGTLNCLRAQLPHMQVGTKGRNGGSIVNASSVSGICGVELNSPYVAAKHAIVGLTRTAAKEEGSKGIRVNCVAPGIIVTPMMKQIEASKGSTELFGPVEPGALARRGDADEVAQAIAFLLGPQSSFVNGVVLPVEGGWIC